MKKVSKGRGRGGRAGSSPRTNNGVNVFDEVKKRRGAAQVQVRGSRAPSARKKGRA